MAQVKVEIELLAGELRRAANLLSNSLDADDHKMDMFFEGCRLVAICNATTELLLRNLNEFIDKKKAERDLADPSKDN